MRFKLQERIDWTTVLFGIAVFVVSVSFIRPPTHFSIFLAVFISAYIIDDTFQFSGAMLLAAGIYPLSVGVVSVFQSGITSLALGLLAVGLSVTLAAGYVIKARQTRKPDPSGSEAYVQMVVLRRVHTELQDAPKTIEELSLALNHTESRVDEAVEYLYARNMVDKRNGEYHLSAAARSFVGRTRLSLRAFLSGGLSNR
jgi:hypothetical protein